jgi:hypothetical protein
MKRVIVFLVFMNFLLLGGGQFVSASNFHHSASHTLDKKHTVRVTIQELGTSIIEDAGLDFEEEDLASDTLNNGLSSKFFTANYSILDSWYLTFSDQNVANDYNRFKIFVPSFGQSNPIYITQRVLRI